MANYVCPECKREVAPFQTRCLNCGTELEVPDLPKKRAVIVSIYLWFATVINGLLTMALFLTLFSDRGIFYADEPIWPRLILFTFSALALTGFILMLRWKRSGFTIITFLSIISLILGIAVEPNVYSISSPITSWLILLLLLKIKKDGVSCMEHLD